MWPKQQYHDCKNTGNKRGKYPPARIQAAAIADHVWHVLIYRWIWQLVHLIHRINPLRQFSYFPFTGPKGLSRSDSVTGLSLCALSFLVSCSSNSTALPRRFGDCSKRNCPLPWPCRVRGVRVISSFTSRCRSGCCTCPKRRCNGSGQGSNCSAGRPSALCPFRTAKQRQEA